MANTVHENMGSTFNGKPVYCINCRRFIDTQHNETWFQVENSAGIMVSGPYCKECAPDLETPEIEKLGKSDGGNLPGGFFAKMGLRIILSLLYIIIGGLCQILVLIFSGGRKNYVHGGAWGELLALISLEKYAITPIYNFNYK